MEQTEEQRKQLIKKLEASVAASDAAKKQREKVLVPAEEKAQKKETQKDTASKEVDLLLRDLAKSELARKKLKAEVDIYKETAAENVELKEKYEQAFEANQNYATGYKTLEAEIKALKETKLSLELMVKQVGRDRSNELEELKEALSASKALASLGLDERLEAFRGDMKKELEKEQEESINTVNDCWHELMTKLPSFPLGYLTSANYVHQFFKGKHTPQEIEEFMRATWEQKENWWMKH